MKFGMMSSAELRACVERAHELRKEYLAQQVRVAKAAFYRLIRGLRHTAASAATGASAHPKCGPSMGMRTAHDV